jgi:hypothetical protein
LKEAMARSQSQMTAELRLQTNVAASLGRELDIARDEIARLNSVVVAQEQKLAAHIAVVELEKKLNIARRAAS